jgi:hypothetical protein
MVKASKHMPWHMLLALVPCSARCSWTLPAPDIAYETSPVVRRDARSLLDTADVVSDIVLGPPDIPRDLALDATTPDADAAGDAPGLDVASERFDTGNDADVSSLGDVRDVEVPEGGCVPPAFRTCFTGDRSTLGSGYCREGAQFCEATFTWSTTCEGEITRDCAGRVCGSDGCGGSCGTCPPGRVCDDSGRCTAPSTGCGPANFIVACGTGNCPANSTCSSGRCRCNANFQARHCNGDPCPPAGCDGTDWWCVPSPFCGGGVIVCTSTSGSLFLCPRWSVCDPINRTCTCRTGFRAQRCDGTPCTSCPGTEYECVPTRGM